MRARFVSSLTLTLWLLPLCAHAAAEDPFAGFYNEAYPEQTADRTLQLSVHGGIHSQIRIHQKALVQSPVLATALSCPDSTIIIYDFDAAEEALAFKKAVVFLYKNFALSAHQDDALLSLLFVPEGLPELLFAAFKYKFDGLGHAFAYFLYKQIEQLHTVQGSRVWLDDLTKEQLHRLYNMLAHFEIQTKAASSWAQQSKAYLDRYASLKLKQDPRLNGLDIKIDPNICELLWAYDRKREEDAKDNAARQREQQDQEQKLRREKELDEQAATFKDEIMKKLGQKIRRQGIKEQSFWVPMNLARSISRQLAAELPAYSVRLRPDTPDPWYGADEALRITCEDSTPGYCVALGIGTLISVACYPIQFLTLNYFGCCCQTSCAQLCRLHPSNEHYFACSCQMAGAAACCLYNTATCCRRSITITPTSSVEAAVGLLKPPPAPSPEKMLDEDGDVNAF